MAAAARCTLRPDRAVAASDATVAAAAPKAASCRRLLAAPRAAHGGRDCSVDTDAVSPPTSFRTWALSLGAAAVVASTTAVALPADARPSSALPQELYQVAGLGTEPIKNARALLRNALPIKNKQIRVAQQALESITDDLRVPGVRFSGVESSVNRALDVVTREEEAILKDVPAANTAVAKAALASLKKSLQQFQVVVSNKDKQEVPYKQQEALGYITEVEEAMVNGFPFAVPAPYDTMPLLKGRAEAEFTFKLKDGRAGNPNIKRGTMKVVLDGYNAPVSAGNFVDLVLRGFYDGMDVQRNDGFVVQSGDPAGPAIGFQDPTTKKLRTIPLEIMVAGDKVPMYGDTLEDVRRFKEDTVLPFNAFGTLAWARDEFDNNSASSQWFFLLKESELTPSGTNILDGRYGVFGYAVEGQDILRDCKVGDIIESVKITRGAENLVNGYSTAKAAPAVEAAVDASETPAPASE